jgi:hypothetical protein
MWFNKKQTKERDGIPMKKMVQYIMMTKAYAYIHIYIHMYIDIPVYYHFNLVGDNQYTK